MRTFVPLPFPFPQMSPVCPDFRPFPLLFLFSFVRFSSAVAFPDLAAERRDSLPKANWVLLAEGNRTAQTVDAFSQAKLADQNARAKVERIERMMNSSLEHNEQILKNGVDALHRLAKDEDKRPNGAAKDGRKGTAQTAALLMPILLSIVPLHLGVFAR